MPVYPIDKYRTFMYFDNLLTIISIMPLKLKI